MNNPLLQVSDFLASQPLKMYINGRWVEAVSGDTFETRDPGEGKILANLSWPQKPEWDRTVGT